MRNADLSSSGSRRIVALLSAVLLATPTWAQEVSPALLKAARQAYRQQQAEQPALRPVASIQSQTAPASETDWNTLSQLAPGARIAVETMDNVTHYGKLVAYSDEALSLLEGKRERGYQRQWVLQVSLLGGPNRSKGATIGLLIGIAIGAASGAVARGAGEDDAASTAVFGGLFWGGIGAGIGAAAAPPAKTLIYQAH